MNTAGCTTGWVNYANKSSQTALEQSSHLVDTQQGGCVYSKQFGMFDQNFLKIILIYLLFLTLCSI